MEKKLLRFEIISTIFICIMGTLLHFTYQWSNQNLFIGTFSSVNESTWEHLKLIFFPMFITVVFGFIYLKKDYNNYVQVKTKGILLAMLFIVVFFYTSTGVLGKSIAFLNIGSFLIAVILGEWYTFKNLIGKSNESNNISPIYYWFILCLFFISFIIFTFNPPRIGLFKDPVTDSYGIQIKG